MISNVAFANDLYSASVLDCATVCCFFEHHDIRFLPKYTKYPPVERRSIVDPAQSESL